MPLEAIIPYFDVIGAIGFVIASVIGIQTYRETNVEKPFWLAFSFTAGLGALWLILVAIEWFGISSVIMDIFSTSLQAVVIGIYAIAVIGTYAIVQDLKQSRAETAQRASIVSILSRVLRHNLRNDLNVIRGYTSMFDDSDEADIIKSLVDDLLALSEKARELDRIVTSDFEQMPTEVVSLVEEVIRDISKEYPSAAITIEHAEEVTASVRPSFAHALKEVLENAIKHTGETPVVTVSVEGDADTVEIRIVDSGPGLGDQDMEVLRTGKETPLSHGSGLGLWLVHWIVASHDGVSDVNRTPDGTEITIAIPRTSTADASQPRSDLSGVRDLYHAAFEQAAEAMLIINDNDQILDANEEAVNVFEVERKEMLGRPLLQILPDTFAAESLSWGCRNAQPRRVNGGRMAPDDSSLPLEYSVTTDIVPGQHLVVSRRSYS